MKRKILTGLVLAFIIGLLILFASPDYRQGEPSLSGHPAKNFQFTADGKSESLADLRGKVVVLNFWATWCPPCVEETPMLEKLQQEIGPRGGVVVGVSLDDDQDAYQNFVRKYGITYLTYRDSSKKIAQTYGTAMYPETYIIDREGKIDRKVIGAQDWTSPEMMAYFDSLLAKN